MTFGKHCCPALDAGRRLRYRGCGGPHHRFLDAISSSIVAVHDSFHVVSYRSLVITWPSAKLDSDAHFRHARFLKRDGREPYRRHSRVFTTFEEVFSAINLRSEPFLAGRIEQIFRRGLVVDTRRLVGKGTIATTQLM